MGIFDKFKRSKISDKDKRWNQFIDEVCSRDIKNLSEVQKNAVLCFWYDCEMQSGGHSGYFDVYSEIVPEELENAILIVSYKKIADNYKRALLKGKKDDFEKTDNAYYVFSPSLFECLRDYVEKNKDEILK